MWILFTSIGKLSISIAALNNHRDILNKYDRFQLIFDKFPISIGILSISFAALNNHRDILNKYDRFQLIFDKFPIRLTCCKISYQVHCIRHEIKFQTLTLVFLHAKNLFGFWIVLLWAYMMNGISETRHARYIWYILFCYYHWVDTSAGGLLVPKIPSTQ